MIELRIDHNVAHLLIKRPDAFNAFTASMLDKFAEAIADAQESSHILVIRGEGPDFSVGRDRAEPESGTPFERFSRIDRANRALADYPGVTVAGVRGRAYGFGAGLAMRCDIALGNADARFCFDEVKLGFPPMFIMEMMVGHVGAKRAADLVLTSREFDAGEALAAGILSRVVAEGQFDTVFDTMISELQGRDATVVRSCKRYMRAASELPRAARPAYALIEQTRFATGSH